VDHIPLDPFANGPMHYLRTTDGYVVYSAGLDGVDHGGQVAPPYSAASDLGVRLYDARARRQPSQPVDLSKYRNP
jgi:hypothetical protein